MTTGMGTRSVYDIESKVYLKNRPWYAYVAPRIIRFVGEAKTTAKMHEGINLVVGTGPGWLERSFPAVEFVSVDISPGMAKLAGAASSNITPIVASGEYLPFREKSVSTVITSRAIKFMDIPRFLDGAKHSLSKEGILLVVYDCGDALWVRLLERVGLRIDPGSNNKTLTSAELQLTLHRAGLAIHKRGVITAMPLSVVGKLPDQFLHLVKFFDWGILGGRMSFILASRVAGSS